MKKLSLLVALGLFTLGTATLVKAQEGADSVIIGSPDTSTELESPDAAAGEFDPLDLNQDGVVDEEEAKAAAEEGAPNAEEAANLEEGVIPVKDAPAPKENLKEELKGTHNDGIDNDGDGEIDEPDEGR